MLDRSIVALFVLFGSLVPAFAAEYRPGEQPPTPLQASSGLFGYADAAGKFVIAAQYEQALPFVDGLARVKKNEGWSLVNEKGKVLTKRSYHEVGAFRNGVAVVSRREYTDGHYAVLYGTVSPKGSEVIASVYPFFTGDTGNSRFIVGKSSPADSPTGPESRSGRGAESDPGEPASRGPADRGPASRSPANEATGAPLQARFGVLNAEGEWVVPMQYQAVRDYNYRLFAVKTVDKPTVPGRWRVFTAGGEECFNADEPAAGGSGPTATPGSSRPARPTGKTASGTSSGSPKSQPVAYTDIKDFDEEYATVKRDSRWGILHRSGRLVKPMVYQEILRTGKSTYNLLPMPQWKVVDQQNNQKFAYEFEDIRAVNEVLYSYQLEGRRGLMDEKGAIITPPVYDRIAPITGNLTVVQTNRKCGVIDQTGKTILPNEYDNILIDSLTSLIKTQNGGKWGVYDRTGKQLVPLRHEALRVQPDGKLVASLGGQWGVMDTQGNPRIPFAYQFIGDFRFGKARAKNQDAWGVLDERGNWLVEPIFGDTRIINDSLCVYFTNGRSGIINTNRSEMRLAVDSLGFMANGFILAKYNGQYGLYNQHGQEIIPIQYDYLSGFGADSMITVRVGDRQGLINTRGRLILRPGAQFRELQVMHEERAGVKINHKYGFIDKEGRLRIANRYEGITPFAEGMAGIRIQGKWGFIDKKEQLRVQPLYDEVRPFRNGVAMVRKGKHWGFTDRNGREVIAPQYDSLRVLPSGRCLITKNGKQGLINEQGKQLFIPKYDYLKDLDNGFLILGIKNKLGLYNLGNYDVVSISYDELVYNPLNESYILGTRYPWQPFTVNR
ncbi:MAG: WG repeat-containing protein [Ferruginibacter sp.]|nr:WG repeat-containing protein [Cytophagales bacterium]